MADWRPLCGTVLARLPPAPGPKQAATERATSGAGTPSKPPLPAAPQKAASYARDVPRGYFSVAIKVYGRGSDVLYAADHEGLAQTGLARLTVSLEDLATDCAPR